MADLIKKIKIKKQDGTFTDYIPIGAEAQNVSTSDGDSVQLKLNKKPYYYNNVSDMKADTKLKAGDMAVTLGYYGVNDGGEATYKITNVESETDYQEELENGLYATLIIINELNSRQLGISENLEDNSTRLQKLFDYSQNYNSVKLMGGEYNVKNSLNIYPTSKIKIDGSVILHDYSTSNFIQMIAPTIEEINNKNGYHNNIFYGETLTIINEDETNDNKICLVIGSSEYTTNGIISNLNIRKYPISIDLTSKNLYWLKLENITCFNGIKGINFNNQTKTNSDELIILDRCCFTRLDCGIYIDNSVILSIQNTAFDFIESAIYSNNISAEINCYNCHFEGIGNKNGKISTGYNGFYGIMKGYDSTYNYNRNNISLLDCKIVGNTLTGFNKKLFKGTSLYVLLKNCIFQYGNSYQNLLKGDNSFENIFLTDSDIREIKIKNCRPLYNDIYPKMYNKLDTLTDPFFESDSTTAEHTITSAELLTKLQDLNYYELWGTAYLTANTKYQIVTLEDNKKAIKITPPHNGAACALALLTKKYFNVDLIDKIDIFAFIKSPLPNAMIKYNLVFYDDEFNEISTLGLANNAANINTTDWFTSSYAITRNSDNNSHIRLNYPANAMYFRIKYFIRATNNANSTNPAYATGFYAFK